jgi:multiple sugar transport system permease protein
MQKKKYFLNRFLFILPAVLLIGSIVISSIFFTISNSFKRYKLTAPDEIEFVGFENYGKVFKEKTFVEALIRTIGITIAVVTIELGIGLIIALFLSRRFKGHGILRSLLVLPLAVTPIVNGLNMRLLFDARIGIVKYFFNALHIPSPDAMLANPTWALGIIIATDVWKFTPFMIIILLAGLLGQEKELYEAALVDGANMFQVYIKIAIPLLKRVMGVALLIRLTDAFRIFDQVYALTEGGPGTSTETLTIHIYREGFRYLNIGTASTMSLVMSIFLMTFVFIMIRRINLLGE